MLLARRLSSWLHSAPRLCPSQISPVILLPCRLLATRAEMAAAAMAPRLTADVAANQLLDRLAAAVAPMAPLNPGFSVTRTPGSLVIKSGSAAGDRVFPVSVEAGKSTVHYVSPRSGLWYAYEWQPGTARWFCAASPHFIEELFVRDLIYVCKGVPDL